MQRVEPLQHKAKVINVILSSRVNIGTFKSNGGNLVSKTPQNFVANPDVRHNVAGLSRKFSKSH